MHGRLGSERLDLGLSAPFLARAEGLYFMHQRRFNVAPILDS